MDQSSYALKQLRTAGLVQSRRDGRVMYYRLADGFPHQLLEHCLRQLLTIADKENRTMTTPPPLAPTPRATTTHGTPITTWAASTAMAVSATLHCLTGCAIGEIAGLIIGTAAGLGNGVDDRALDRAGVRLRLHRCRRCRC